MFSREAKAEVSCLYGCTANTSVCTGLFEGPDNSQCLSGFLRRNDAKQYKGFSMADFRPILLSASGGVRAAGWVVEKYDNGQKIGVVSQLFTTRAAAKAEVDRLNAQEPPKT